MSKDIRKRHALTKFHISRTALEGWIRTVRKHGYTELHVFRRKDRPSQTMARPKKKKNLKQTGKASGGKPAPEGRECVTKKVKALQGTGSPSTFQ